MKRFSTADYPIMNEDFECFYEAMDTYNQNPTDMNRVGAEQALHWVYCSLKAHRVTGHITQPQFEEIISTCKEELYGPY